MQRLVLPSDMEAEEAQGLHLRADGGLVKSLRQPALLVLPSGILHGWGSARFLTLAAWRMFRGSGNTCRCIRGVYGAGCLADLS
jgi:hypothetical protein